MSWACGRFPCPYNAYLRPFISQVKTQRAVDSFEVVCAVPEDRGRRSTWAGVALSHNCSTLKPRSIPVLADYLSNYPTTLKLYKNHLEIRLLL